MSIFVGCERGTHVVFRNNDEDPFRMATVSAKFPEFHGKRLLAERSFPTTLNEFL